MSPAFVLFGKDFVNDHIIAIDEMSERNYRPIEYINTQSELVISFMKNHILPIKRLTLFQKGSPRVYITFNNTLYECSYELYFNLHNSIYMSLEISQAELNSTPLKIDRSEIELLNMVNININNKNKSFTGHTTHQTLIIDALFLPYPKILTDLEIWLTSSTPRLNLQSFLMRADYRDVMTLVAHLDPIIQSSFFKKAIGFFPAHIESVLNKFNAVHYPDVISLMDTKIQEWGLKNCSNSFI
jgi:hypothetical protein